jgi:hypothetical protein
VKSGQIRLQSIRTCSDWSGHTTTGGFGAAESGLTRGISLPVRR